MSAGKPVLRPLGMILTSLGVVVTVICAAALITLFAHQAPQGDPRAVQCEWLLGGGLVAGALGVALQRIGRSRPRGPA